MCLTRLHNYCINSGCSSSARPTSDDVRSIKTKATMANQEMFELDELDRCLLSLVHSASVNKLVAFMASVALGADRPAAAAV